MERSYKDVINSIQEQQDKIAKLIELIDLDTEIEMRAIAQLEREAAANAN